MADWREPSAYAALLRADRSLIAWEWLRRNRDYRVSFARALQAGITPGKICRLARSFGLLAFEPPDLTIPDARPLWHSSVYPQVLEVHRAAPNEISEPFDPGRVKELSRLITGVSRDHLLLSDGFGMIRLDGPSKIFSAGPTRLRFVIGNFEASNASIVALRRFADFVRTNRFSPSLYRKDLKAERRILFLRVADALADGVTQREIAELLPGRRASQSKWRIHDPSLRSQVQRLVRSVQRISNGGYFDLLA